MIARMHLRVVQLLIAIIIFLNYDEIESLSKKEDEELERQLKLLNKPAIKTIKTEYGDIYDCVDFYQQPAFDHPLLKNHTYHPQMKPSFSVTKRNNIESSTSNSSPRIGLKDEGCPMGTVPIRRTTKEDLIRERKANRFNASYADQGISYYAQVQTTYDTNNKFSGADMISSIYVPNVQSNQWSAAYLQVETSPDQIQTGWRVDPILYGDNNARFFSSFKNGPTRCFSTRCPGFIIVNTSIILDKVYSPTSVPGSISVDMYSIEMDVLNGHWWLYYSTDKIPVGFWPVELFTGLKGLDGFAARVSWGGEVFSSGPTFPPMGSGSYPTSPDSDKDAYCRALSLLDSTGNFITAGDDLSIVRDNKLLYSVLYRPDTNPDFGHAVFFGGPGTN